MNRIFATHTLVAIAVAALGAGCTSTTPQLDSHFGEAVNLAKAQQTLNPDAAKNTAPVVGMDGRAAQQSVERYEKSFQQPPLQANPFVIGVGSGSSSGGGQ
jgi:hypothetical protein